MLAQGGAGNDVSSLLNPGPARTDLSAGMLDHPMGGVTSALLLPQPPGMQGLGLLGGTGMGTDYGLWPCCHVAASTRQPLGMGCHVLQQSLISLDYLQSLSLIVQSLVYYT